MRGGEVFLKSIVAHGTTYMFGNPGTTENPILDRLIDFPGISYVTALHEGVAVSAATFYALATGNTGIVNLHVAPGLGNGIGAAFGGLKAEAPVIVTAGQQDTRLRTRRTVLGHDLVAMAAPVTKWSAEPQCADEIAPIMQKAFEIAHTPPCGPVFVSLPVNVMEEETDVAPQAPAPVQSAGPMADEKLEQLVDALISARRPAIVAGDDVAARGVVSKLVSLAEQTAACVFRESMYSQVSFPTNHPNFRGRIPFNAENIREVLGDFDLVLLVGGQFFEELWFDEGNPVPDGVTVARIEETPERLSSSFPVQIKVLGNIPDALDRISSRFGEQLSDDDRRLLDERNREYAVADGSLRREVQSRIAELPDTLPMQPARAVHEICKALPDDAVIIDESITASLLDLTRSSNAIVGGAMYTSLDLGFSIEDQGDFFGGRGGGLGQAMAGAIGLQIAYPDRPVVALIGDGSAMYTIQSLWTAAHQKLPILFIIFANREYRVLKHNLDIYRHRFGIEANRPYPHMDLSSPALSYPEIARGMGVEGECITDPDALPDAIAQALAAKKPYLIEIEISGKP